MSEPPNDLLKELEEDLARLAGLGVPPADLKKLKAELDSLRELKEDVDGLGQKLARLTAILHDGIYQAELRQRGPDRVIEDLRAAGFDDKAITDAAKRPQRGTKRDEFYEIGVWVIVETCRKAMKTNVDGACAHLAGLGGIPRDRVSRGQTTHTTKAGIRDIYYAANKVLHGDPKRLADAIAHVGMRVKGWQKTKESYDHWERPHLAMMSIKNPRIPPN